MRFSVLASGSRANVTYLELGSTRLLIDCGLSATKTAERLVRYGIDPSSISAILVTHEHHDHIAGVRVFSRRFKVPVYCNDGAREFLDGCYAYEGFETGATFSVGQSEIHPFQISHDSADPVGFAIDWQGARFAQATDLGRVTPLVRECLRGAHALVLESNHDEELLFSCGYPWSVAQRISSNHGHLSNRSSAELLGELLHADLTHVVLAHISENSNTPDLALRQAFLGISAFQGRVPAVHCASQQCASPFFQVGEKIPRTAVSEDYELLLRALTL